MTIVETTCSVVAGVDTHADVHVAAVVDHVGGVLGIEAFDTTAAGCRQLVEWLVLARRDQRRSVSRALARTGLALTRHLTRAGIGVVEVIGRIGRSVGERASP